MNSLRLEYKIRKTINRKSFSNKKTQLNYIEYENNIPNNTLVAIYLIESNARPLFFRIAEYSLLTLNFLANRLFGKAVKNYTLGKCQLGISHILNYYGYNYYPYLEYIPKLTFSDFSLLIKSCMPNRHYYILGNRIKLLSIKARKIYSKDLTDNLFFEYIGKQFNGDNIYGYILKEIVDNLSKEPL